MAARTPLWEGEIKNMNWEKVADSLDASSMDYSKDPTDSAGNANPLSALKADILDAISFAIRAGLKGNDDAHN